MLQKKEVLMKMTTGYMGLALSLAAVSVLTFTGCGSSSSSTPPAEEVGYNGKFIDSAVAGVSFVCDSVSGITDANGVFGTCPAGSTVTFSIGGLVLGSSAATDDNIFFVTDIVEGAERTDTDNPDVLDIAVLLQSLDSDGDPSNGITVPAEAAEIMDTLVEDGTSISDVQVTLLTTELVTELVTIYPDVTVVTVEEAEANLVESVEEIEDGTITPPPAEPIVPTGSEGGS